MSARRVAVFGSSEPPPGSPAYESARALGAALARAGMGVVTGGYGGVMEAACRGAKEAGGRTAGVGCALFAHRAMNRWLDEASTARDLHDRTRDLIDRADAFVVLPGRAGTLAELTMLWALDRAGCLGPRPVVVFDPIWSRLVDLLEDAGVLEPSQLAVTRRATTVEDAVRLVSTPADRAAPGGDGT